jgi:hypothetical protein
VSKPSGSVFCYLPSLGTLDFAHFSLLRAVREREHLSYVCIRVGDLRLSYKNDASGSNYIAVPCILCPVLVHSRDMSCHAYTCHFWIHRGSHNCWRVLARHQPLHHSLIAYMRRNIVVYVPLTSSFTPVITPRIHCRSSHRKSEVYCNLIPV